jgi:ring-1,2-phenylacetyl-CoA epoxidase subunit PaaB
MKSLDPRINRINPDIGSEYEISLENPDEWVTYEVFHQKRRGEQHIHVGIVHAPNPEIALILAKESFGRRRQTANIWVVRSSDVYSTSYDDQDIFMTTPEKTYREASDYYCMDRIRKYQKEHGIVNRKELKEAKEPDTK